jgi:tRNA A-37 threonylcarbamoyl transferase component Bud32
MDRWTVPGYTEVRPVGTGGFGAVMLATHDATGTPVAVKYLRPDLLHDPDFVGMFRSEAVTLSSLDNPYVVRLYEYVEGPPGAAIVMELINGVSLQQILASRGATTPEAALMVLYGSLLGLAAAHARGVVHRDYKPANVLVSGSGASKLADFGIAERTGTRGTAAGTLRYAPPEQFEGAPASPAGDVYAATVTFYECVVGRPPFVGKDTQDLLRQHRFAEVPLDPVPVPLQPLVARGMAKDPRYRPADAGAFAAELRSAAVGVYGQDWENRGRSYLGEAALLLAALWPAAGVPALGGMTVEQVRLSGGGHHGAGSYLGGHQTANGPLSPGTQHRTMSRAAQHRLHLKHILHLDHLNRERQLRHLRNGALMATACAVVAAGITVAATRGSHPPPDTVGLAAHPVVAAYPVALTPAPLSASALTGTWSGTYVCSQGETGLRLVMLAAPGGTLTATFNFFAVPSNPGVPSGSYTMTGTYSSKAVNLTGNQWITEPSGYEMVDISANPPTQNDKTLNGTITSCGTTFTLTRSAAP